MQLQLDLEPAPIIEKKFYMTVGRFSEEICYTAQPACKDVLSYTENQAFHKLRLLGYSEKTARSLLSKAKHSGKWIVFSYQQCFNF